MPSVLVIQPKELVAINRGSAHTAYAVHIEGLEAHECETTGGAVALGIGIIEKPAALGMSYLRATRSHARPSRKLLEALMSRYIGFAGLPQQ